MLKDVICFTVGDSNKASTWSGIPFFFTTSLEEKGVNVYRVNLAPPKWLTFLYMSVISKVYSLCFHKSFRSIYNTIIYRGWANSVIKKKSRLFPSSQLSIFFSYNFVDISGSRPSVLLCDWNLQYYIDKRLNRKPTFLERRLIMNQNAVMNKAALIISLFPQCARYMEQNSSIKKVEYLKSNVVNNYCAEPDSQIILKKKQAVNILFIGREHYLEGYNILVKSFEQLCDDVKSCRLNVIGLSMDDVVLDNGGKICHYGYLRKENNEECQLYYKLLSEATLVVNVNPRWAGYSSIIEAMYYFTPIIVSSFDTFVEEFGRELYCGYYCDDQEQLVSLIKSVLFHPDYENLCYNSHKLVENHTWTNYIDKFMEIVTRDFDL